LPSIKPLSSQNHPLAIVAALGMDSEHCEQKNEIADKKKKNIKPISLFHPCVPVAIQFRSHSSGTAFFTFFSPSRCFFLFLYLDLLGYFHGAFDCSLFLPFSTFYSFPSLSLFLTCWRFSGGNSTKV
jgi:hypothetical protein